MEKMDIIACSLITILIAANLFLASIMAFYGLRETRTSAKSSGTFVVVLSLLNAVTLGGMYLCGF